MAMTATLSEGNTVTWMTWFVGTFPGFADRPRRIFMFHGHTWGESPANRGISLFSCPVPGSHIEVQGGCLDPLFWEKKDTPCSHQEETPLFSNKFWFEIGKTGPIPYTPWDCLRSTTPMTAVLCLPASPRQVASAPAHSRGHVGMGGSYHSRHSSVMLAFQTFHLVRMTAHSRQPCHGESSPIRHMIGQSLIHNHRTEQRPVHQEWNPHAFVLTCSPCLPRLLNKWWTRLCSVK